MGRLFQKIPGFLQVTCYQADCEWRYGKEIKVLEKELIKIFKIYIKEVLDNHG